MKSQKPQDKYKLIEYFIELKGIDDQIKLIIVGSTFLEQLVNIIIEAETKGGTKISKGSEYTYAIKLVILHEKDIIDDKLFKHLNKLREIRNNVAHQLNFEFKPETIQSIKKNKNDTLSVVFQDTIAYLWATNKKTIGKRIDLSDFFSD